MKKVIIILLLLIPFIVKADTDKFSLSFETPKDMFLFQTKSYQDGYIMSDYDGTKGILRYYDTKGELISEIPLTNGRTATDLFVYDNYLYTLECDFSTGNNVHFVKYTEDLTVESDINMKQSYYYTPVYSSYFHRVEILRNGNIALANYDDNIIMVVNKDMEIVEEIPYNFNYISNNFESIKLNTLNNMYYPTQVNGPIAFFELGDYNYVGLKATKTCESTNIIYSHSTEEGTYYEDCYYYTIEYYDSDLNKLWSTDLTDFHLETIFNAKDAGDYLIVSAYSKDKSYILIFDSEGNVVQTIENERYVVFSYIDAIDNGFVIAERCGTPNGQIGTDDCRASHKVFLLNNEIESVSEGKGEITVPTDAKVGDIISIDVKPEKGYVLGELLVFDESGNQIPVENNTFTMGTSKVTVRAVFIPENPNTGNFGLLIITVLAIISGFALVIQKRKLTFLK